jgi:hypothetical protein
MAVLSPCLKRHGKVRRKAHWPQARIRENPWMSIREDTVRGAYGSTGIYAVLWTPSDVAVVIHWDGHRFHSVERTAIRLLIGVDHPVARCRRKRRYGRAGIDSSRVACSERKRSAPSD